MKLQLQFEEGIQKLGLKKRIREEAAAEKSCLHKKTSLLMLFVFFLQWIRRKSLAACTQSHMY